MWFRLIALYIEHPFDVSLQTLSHLRILLPKLRSYSMANYLYIDQFKPVCLDGKNDKDFSIAALTEKMDILFQRFGIELSRIFRKFHGLDLEV